VAAVKRPPGRPKGPGPRKFGTEKRAERARSSIIDRELRTFTEREQKFLDGIDMGMSLLNAGRHAGYAHPSKTVHALLDKTHIREELQRRMTKTRAHLDMTREKVQKMVVEAYDVAKLQGDAGSMVRAAAEINKMCGYYATVERHVQLDVTMVARQEQLRALPDAELIKMAGRDVGLTLEGDATRLIEREVEAILEEELLVPEDESDDPDAD
jgi:predicted transcriptional regulator